MVVFAKVPGIGIAKSRIAETQGKEKAAQVYEELLNRTAETVRDLPYHIAYTGDEDYGSLLDIFPQAQTFFMQNGETLGDRLYNAFNNLFETGHSHVCAIGTDCPTLSKRDLGMTFFLLKNDIDTVIGPAHDGGYYLIAGNKKSLAAFSATQWSTPELFDETVNILEAQSLMYHLLKPRSDIDYIEDYLQWKKSL